MVHFGTLGIFVMSTELGRVVCNVLLVSLFKKFIYLFYVASNINQSILNEACVTAGSSARVSEQRKHAFNDVNCSELGWSCIPLAVETYGCWKAEARLHPCLSPGC